MRYFAVALIALAIQSASAGAFVCEEYVNKYGQVADHNCVWHPEIEANITTPHRDGDVKRIRESGNDTVYVERYGREGEVEEWREVTKGEWVRKR